MPTSKLPAGARAGQEAAFYLGAQESFKEEHNIKGAILQGKIDALNNLIGDIPAYVPIPVNGKIRYIESGTISTNRFAHIDICWKKIIEGISLGDVLLAQQRMAETRQANRNFNKYMRGNFLPRTELVNGKINAALKKCGEDSHWNTHNGVGQGNDNIPFSIENGKLKYNLPSAGNESSNIAALHHYIANNSDIAEDSPEMEALQTAIGNVKQAAYAKGYWKPDIEQIIADIPYPDLPDPNEDFTGGTWQEFDLGGFLGVAQFLITATILPRNTDSFVYDNKGAGHFGDFTQLFAAKLTAAVIGSTGGFWALANAVNDLLGLFSNDVLAVYNNTISGNNRFILEQRDGGAFIGQDVFNNAITNQQYYFTPSRASTAIQCLIHDDINRLNLVSTLGFTGVATTYQYVYGALSYNSGIPTQISFESGPLDLQEVAVGIVILRRRMEE